MLTLAHNLMFRFLPKTEPWECCTDGWPPASGLGRAEGRLGLGRTLASLVSLLSESSLSDCVPAKKSVLQQVI